MHKIKSATIPDEGRAHKVLPIAEELLAVDDCWGKESHINLKVGHDGLSIFQWVVLTQAHMYYTYSVG